MATEPTALQSPPAANDNAPRDAWASVPSAIPVALVAAALVYGLWSGWRLLHEHWTTTYTYSHGYLVAAISLWLFWRSVREQGLAPPRPYWPALIGLAAVALVFGVAEIISVNIARILLLPVALWLAVTALGGLALGRQAFGPLAFLSFAVPIWEVLTRPLQDLTTAVVSVALRVTDITAYIEGHLVYIPAGVFEIAEGCSGLHFVIVGLALAAMCGHAYLRRWRSRGLLLLAALAAAVAANWIRVFTLIIVGHVTEMRHYLIVEDHYYFGWIVFAVVISPVFLLAARLERRELVTRDEKQPEPSARPPQAGAEAPAAGTVWSIALVAALLLAAPAVFRVSHVERLDAAPEVLPPPVVAGWSETRVTDANEIRFVGADAVLRAGFAQSRPSDAVDVFLARYAAQSDHAKVTSDLNRLTPAGWQREATGTRSATLGDGARQLVETTLVRGAQRRVAWRWYRIGGRPAHGRLQARLLEIPAAVAGRRDGGAIVLLADCHLDCAEARGRLAEFVEAAGPALEALADGH